ncbi:glutamine--fructose-6-phosphate transaminase (isomerizing) [Limibaculum sp. M0105]|uniref:Glutamine--fructose-6-phosphate aminotransferase [isomerizing] n=1 Tax=Thermohalobaculum xanthum TaxID=2753746 RepID=A0A8J7M9Y8_9RHOB|nr:glutamine--fructose-6-phosphate transaminase (isomerizing) [Thermohalobaculum xanthum]MBK0400913.1 glutamine--fructose-6-phosphate transaminase (isomerizing) [Thermohalobaculum xanthum]
MCGIIGILGQLEAAPRILDALKRLEYRGYDSAGLTTLLNGKPIRRRAVGKLSALRQLVAADPAPGSTGIGHTRWATHGAPTVVNAHPHAAGPVHVVHNGIIENFRELREELTEAGCQFETETDTEVVAQMVAHLMAGGAEPFEAVSRTLDRVSGAFALAFLFKDQPDLLIAARHGSPLAIGWGEDEMFVGSDAIALSPMTSEITYLEEGDRAILHRSGAQIFDAEGKPVKRARRFVAVEQSMVEKAGHKHFMAKEIHEQPGAVGLVVARNVSADRSRIASPADALPWDRISRLMLIACGTASYAGHIAKYWFEGLAGIPVELDIASEFRYRDHPLLGDEAAVFISQSGETADTLAALRHVTGRVQATAAVVNVVESSIAREAGIVLPILAGPEIGVASTKAFTCQLATLAAAAILAARMRGRLDKAAEARMVAEYIELPRLLTLALEDEARVAGIAQDIAAAQDVLYLGRGPMFPIALEGALKLKEISYIHAEGYASGELKHGPIALVDESVPVIVMAPRDALFEKTVSNMQEVMARGGRVVLVSDAAGIEAAGDGVWRTIRMPDCAPWLAPVLYAVPAQLLAYHAALAKGTDVDQPRNLAKSVTVE